MQNILQYIMISKSKDKILFFIRYRYNLIYRALVLLMAMILIVISLPKTIQFNYQYVKGLPWAYSELIAPFDFAILKTKEELANEKTQLLKQLIPYYSLSNKITDSVFNQLNRNFEEEWNLKYRNVQKEFKTNTYNLIHKLFNHVSSVGIISGNELKSETGEINILSGNSATLVYRQSIYTLQTAQLYYQNEINQSKGIDKEIALNVLQNSLFINLLFDQETTMKDQERILGQISPTYGLVQNGELIISKGELVSAAKFQILYSLENEFNKQFGGSAKFRNLVFGQILLVLLSFGLLILFIGVFSPGILNDKRQILLILSSILIIIIPFSLLIHSSSEYILLFPIALLPLVLRPFFDEKISLMVHLITVLMISTFVPDGLQFVFLQMIAGIIAVIGIKSMHKRGQIFFTSLLIFIGYVLGYYMLLLVMDGGLEKFKIVNIYLFAGSAVLTLFSFPLIFLSEKVFTQLTDISLLELSDMNSPLLRELARKAPGTFQHSIQVGNMSEAVVQEIGGNPLLVHVGALYHDIGKIYNPRYFIENQITGLNPHDELSYEESVALIKGHVELGIQLAKKHNIPDPIIDFIRTHHGNRRVEYFYRHAVKDLGQNAVYEEDFSYNGPIPFSRETAVLMMADSVEAAARSIPKPDEDNISQLVEAIIDSQIDADQFINSNITFRDIYTTKKIFKRFLLNVYHIRMEYPK